MVTTVVARPQPRVAPRQQAPVVVQPAPQHPAHRACAGSARTRAAGSGTGTRTRIRTRARARTRAENPAPAPPTDPGTGTPPIDPGTGGGGTGTPPIDPGTGGGGLTGPGPVEPAPGLAQAPRPVPAVKRTLRQSRD